jgi:Arc/MetJ family transcription regulator
VSLSASGDRSRAAHAAAPAPASARPVPNRREALEIAASRRLTVADDQCIIICMRTTLDIDEDLLKTALRLTGAATKTEVIELGLRALVEQAARRRLAALAGSVPGAKAPPRR